MHKKRLLITGGSGFIGFRLVRVLFGQGYDVMVLTRYPEKTASRFNHAVSTIKQLDELDDTDVFDVVINLAGQGITDSRWTVGIKKQLRESRIVTTQKLIHYLQATEKKPECFISGSAIGYYGNQENKIVDEQMHGDSSFSSKLCFDWEHEAQQAEVLGIRTCYLRTGIVLGKNGGALAKMLPAFKLGLGGAMGDGRQWMSWVHIDDLIGIMLHIINDKNIKGAVNGTAPNPVANKEFSSTLASVLKRPTFFTMPAFVLKLMLGEMAQELLLSGQRVMPKKILDAGYRFKYAELKDALREVVKN
ncbi:MAG: TIGR01777 family protein [Gammaproteobacteria bacterium]|nr:TIGR01777 family protein [Gammaproteobacteria bacterium]